MIRLVFMCSFNDELLVQFLDHWMQGFFSLIKLLLKNVFLSMFVKPELNALSCVDLIDTFVDWFIWRWNTIRLLLLFNWLICEYFLSNSSSFEYLTEMNFRDIEWCLLRSRRFRLLMNIDFMFHFFNFRLQLSTTILNFKISFLFIIGFCFHQRHCLLIFL